MHGKTGKYTSVNTGAAIKQCWKRQQEGIVLIFHKLKTTCSGFLTTVTFDDEKTFDINNSAVVPTTIIKKSELSKTNIKNRNKRKKNYQKTGRKNKNTSQPCKYSHFNRNRLPIREKRIYFYRINWIKNINTKDDCEFCLACIDVSYFLTKCYLVFSPDKNWILKKNWKTFRSLSKKELMTLELVKTNLKINSARTKAIIWTKYLVKSQHFLALIYIAITLIINTCYMIQLLCLSFS